MMNASRQPGGFAVFVVGVLLLLGPAGAALLASGGSSVPAWVAPVSTSLGAGLAATDAFANASLPCSPHPPIEITERVGPTGFEWINPVTGEEEPRPGSGVVGGSGTVEDPYVIDGWCIQGLRSEPAGIRLAGTRAHATITENRLVGQPQASLGASFTVRPGLALENATNVTAEENNLTLDWAPGISVEASREVLLEANQIQGNDGGIWIDTSEHVVARANNITGSDSSGIDTWRSSDLTLEANRLTGAGIALESTPSSRVVGNVVDGAPGTGMVLDNSSYSEVRFNTITRAGGHGLGVGGGSTGVTVEANRIKDSLRSGIQAFGISALVSNITIQGNRLSSNAIGGIVLGSVLNATVTNNHVTETHQDGIVAFYKAQKIRISGNTVTANHRHGMVLDAGDSFGWVNNSTVGHNTIDGNAESGLHLVDVENTTIHDNNITQNDLGLSFKRGTGYAIHGNNIVHNERIGLDANRMPQMVNATRNWWGCPAGPDAPACDEVQGPVLVDPWLGSPNPDAGRRS